MFNKFLGLLLISAFLLLVSGCTLLKLALSAGAAYGLSQVLQ